MEKIIDHIQSPEEKAQYIADILITRAHFTEEIYPSECNGALDLVALEIEESPWRDITPKDVVNVIMKARMDLKSQSDLDEYLINTYAKLNRDFGIKFKEDAIENEFITNLDQEEPLEMAMSFDEIIDFCKTAKKGDRVGFLNIDDDQESTPEGLEKMLKDNGINATVIAQAIGNYFIIVVSSGLISTLLR